MLGNLLGDKKNIAMLLLGDHGEGEKPLSSDMGTGGEKPEARAKEAALKEFFAAGNAGNWKSACKALAAFVDLHDLMDDEDE